MGFAGELVIDTEPPIELRAELASTEAGKKAAVLKDRLAYLLDTRFRPAIPNRLKLPASPSRTWRIASLPLPNGDTNDPARQASPG